MRRNPQEREKFKVLLARTSLEGIRRALDSNRIWLPWKRKLAEDERGRRARNAEDGEKLKIENATQRRKSLTRRSWTIALILLAMVISIVAVSVLNLWHL